MSHEWFLSANFSCVHDHKMDDSSDDKALATTALFLCMRKRKKRNLTMWNVTIDITEVDSSPLWSSPRHSAAWIFQTEGTDQSQLVISANISSCFLTRLKIFFVDQLLSAEKNWSIFLRHRNDFSLPTLSADNIGNFYRSCLMAAPTRPRITVMSTHLVKYCDQHATSVQGK